MKKNTVYRAVASLGAEAWEVDVPEFGVHTQARRIDQVAEAATTAILQDKGANPDWGFTVEFDLANPYAPNDSFPMAVVCDIDGTLALHKERGPFEFEKVETDARNEAVVLVLDSVTSVGHRVILLSGRQEEYRPHTERWLEKHLIPYHHLYMRAEGDRRSDDIVKMELFDLFVRDRFNAWLVLDDRDRCVYLWRKLGLPCFQVAPGAF